MKPGSLAWLVVVVLGACGGGGAPESGDVGGEVLAVADLDTVLDLARRDALDEGPDAAPPRAVEHGGVSADQVGDEVVLANGAVEVRYRLEAGTWDVFGPGGEPVLLAAEARFVLDDGTWDGVPHGTSGHAASGWEAEAVDDVLGAGVRLRVEVPTDGPVIFVELELRGIGTFVLVRAHGVWPEQGAAALRVRDGVPLVADGRTGGALFVGADPWAHMVLDDGADMYFDFAARVFRVGQGGSVFFPPGSVANWNMAVSDSESPRSLVAGYLTFDKAFGLIRLHHEPDVAMELDGRTGFSRFEAFGRLEPPVPPPSDSARFAPDTRTLSSELFYLDVAPASPWDGLEGWAERFALWHGKTPWTDVPTGWNSWGGGSGSGGLGAHIDEALILENLDLMMADLAPFGMQYFLLDDGWQVDHGDWDTDPRFFPSHDGQDGLWWIADRIREAGVIPGIWIAPFWVHRTTARLAVEHPDWLAPISEYGNLLMDPAKDGILDLSNPEVLAWIHELFTRITQDWGYKWIKMDFAYYALFPAVLHNPEKTSAEAFQDALAVIRDAIGPDTFFLTISAMGLCMGVADGSRLTLDNEPTWGDGEGAGIKVTQRTAAHRYYLSRLWVNHPDLLFYRPTPYGLTLGEARTWTSQVALLGGIVKVG
ncbi:MAG: alpha-galactosidase, partial [Deltaproteobacteria bacterium]|nr:alpha-galactosidase [Deltaproteobacteria bacterium]